jgi:hypothetical protein
VTSTNALHLPTDTVWQPSLFALKASADHATLAELRQYLLEAIPQNSEATRLRTTRYILMRFFPAGNFDSLPRRVWLAYRDIEILEMVMRYYYLARERLVGRFMEEVLFSLEPGTTFDRRLIVEFVTGLYSTPPRIKMGISRIQEAGRELGFIERSAKGNIYRVLTLSNNETPLLILLHHLFASEPRTITLKDILASPFWKDIGFRSEDNVRQVLKEAAAKDILAKYVVADQLEQVTTKYALDEFLAQRVRL